MIIRPPAPRLLRLLPPHRLLSTYQPLTPLPPRVSPLPIHPQPTTTTLHSSSGLPSDPHPMPSQMPREDYSSPLEHSMSLTFRVLKYIFYSIIGLGGATLMGVEGIHQYVEHTRLPPSRPSASSSAEQWEFANPTWTGGESSGTSPTLSIIQRHLLRSAWIAQTWGSGSAPSTIGSSGFGHPDFSGERKGMIGMEERGGVNKVDKGFQMALGYLEALITSTASTLSYPPNLSIHRPALPPVPNPTESTPEISPVALDILHLQAALLELISTPSSLLRSRALYERVLLGYLAKEGEGRDEPRVLGLVKKLGDLSGRVGEREVAGGWLVWGLGRVGVEVGARATPEDFTRNIVVTEKSGSWWSSLFGAKQVPIPTPSTPSPPTSPPGLDLQLPPPILRATIDLLQSLSTTLIPTSIATSASVLTRSLSLIDSHPSITTSASSRLQSLFLDQRKSLINLHLAEITFAQTKDLQKSIELLETARSEGEKVFLGLTGISIPPGGELDPTQLPPTLPLCPKFLASTLRSPADTLLKDTLRTLSHSSLLLGTLHERAANAGGAGRRERLEMALEGFERAGGWGRVVWGEEEGRGGGEGGKGGVRVRKALEEGM